MENDNFFEKEKIHEFDKYHVNKMTDNKNTATTPHEGENTNITSINYQIKKSEVFKFNNLESLQIDMILENLKEDKEDAIENSEKSEDKFTFTTYTNLNNKKFSNSITPTDQDKESNSDSIKESNVNETTFKLKKIDTNYDKLFTNTENLSPSKVIRASLRVEELINDENLLKRAPTTNEFLKVEDSDFNLNELEENFKLVESKSKYFN